MPENGAKKRSDFYTKATHILFAIIIGHSFLVAPDSLIPTSNALKPENHTMTAALVFSYIFIVSSWIGYARSVSFSPHTDTGWGAIRFVINLIILYEFFYLIRVSQTEHVGELPTVACIIFMTFYISDIIKYHEYGPQDKKLLTQRRRITEYAMLFGILAMASHNAGYWGFVSLVDINTLILTIIVFTIIAVLFRVAKWRPIDKKI